MTRRKKIVHAEDGTPIETDEDLPLDPQSQSEPKADVRAIVITKLGEDVQAWTEHGTHQEGDRVETAFANIFIERGWAREAD